LDGGTVAERLSAAGSCRPEIIDAFLAEATDSLDECEGLRNAFHGLGCGTSSSVPPPQFADAFGGGAALSAGGPKEKRTHGHGHHKNPLHRRQSLRRYRKRRKECCGSLKRQHRGSCDGGDPRTKEHAYALFLLLVSCCSFVRTAIRRYGCHVLPESAGCVLAGAVAAALLLDDHLARVHFDDHVFLRVLLPPVVFEMALNIDKAALRRHAPIVLLFAVVGTLLSTAVAAVVVKIGSDRLSSAAAGGLPWVDAGMFAALISSVDGVATLGVLQSLGVDETDTLYVVIFGEGLLNDGAAVVLFETLVGFADDAAVADGAALRRACAEFVVVFCGSAALGWACAFFCVTYFRICNNFPTMLPRALGATAEASAFFAWGALPYFLCDKIMLSGIVAIVVAGVIMDERVLGGSTAADDDAPGRPRVDLLSYLGRRYMHLSLETVSTLMETAVFGYLGVFMFSSRFHWRADLIALGIAGCLISRAIMVAALSFLWNGWGKIRRRARAASRRCDDDDDAGGGSTQFVAINGRTQFVLWFSGLRGAMSFAMVENIPMYDVVSGKGSRFKPELKAMTSASIFVTIFFFGGGAFHLLRFLGFSEGDNVGGGGGEAPKDRSGGTKYDGGEIVNAGTSGEDDGLPQKVASQKNPTAGDTRQRHRQSIKQ